MNENVQDEVAQGSVDPSVPCVLDLPSDLPIDDASAEEGDENGAVVNTGGASEEVIGALRGLESGLEQLRSEVGRFHERSREYESNARTMHARIEALQQDQVRVLLKPVFERLAGLHAQANEIASQKEETDTQTAGDFFFFAESIEELFSLYDLNSVDAIIGSPFDAREHAATRAIKTDQAELDGTVQRVVRQGFGFTGSERVFLPARVAVYSYQETSEAVGQQDELAEVETETTPVRSADETLLVSPTASLFPESAHENQDLGTKHE